MEFMLVEVSEAISIHFLLCVLWERVHVMYCIFLNVSQTVPLTVQEFDKVESAQQIMESDARYQFNLDGTSLRLDYSHGVQPAAALSASAGSDWICPACAAVNFSR